MRGRRANRFAIEALEQIYKRRHFNPPGEFSAEPPRASMTLRPVAAARTEGDRVVVHAFQLARARLASSALENSERIPRGGPYPQNFGTFGDTTPGNVFEAPFSGPLT